MNMPRLAPEDTVCEVDDLLCGAFLSPLRVNYAPWPVENVGGDGSVKEDVDIVPGT